MSRRFQHQSSSASSNRFARPQSHPSPASASASSRSTRFALPSSTQQQPASTPGTSISRFRDKPRLQDEIETSFEEAEQSSPQLPSRSRLSSSVSQYRDVVDDLDDDEEAEPTRSRRGVMTAVQDDSLADLEFLERVRGTLTRQHPRSIDIDSSSSEDEDTITPIASRKRRRLNNRTDHDFNTLDSNDPIEPMPGNKENNKNNKNNNDHPETGASSDSDLPSSPLTTSTHPPPPPGTRSSRFKLGPHTPTHSSLTHTTPTAPTASTTNTHKPTFRPPPPNQHAQATSSSAHLPATFSPSHRRRGAGGRAKATDYLPGGAADTVRNLVLGLGAAEEQARIQRRGQGVVEKVKVGALIGRDAGTSERCVLLRDEGARGWVLIGAAGSGAGWSKRVEAGRVVGVRMGWDVDLRRSRLTSTRTDEHLHEEDGGGGSEDVWRVAVLWDVLDG